MFIFHGQTFINDNRGTPRYSQTVRRAALKTMFIAETTHISSSASLDVDIEHRNHDESWAVAQDFSGITSPGIVKQGVTALKEQVRIAVDWSAGSAAGSNAVLSVQMVPISD